jgi:chemotaxis protein MotB
MKRRSASKERVGHDRWLVSYADFITLLFGLFVVMYAFAKSDQTHQRQVSRAIDSAFQSMGILPGMANRSSDLAGREDAVVPVNVIMGEEALSPAEVKDDLTRVQRELTQTLSNQVAAHTVSIQMGRDGLVISLREAGFFGSGSATPKPAAFPTLRQIAASLGQTSYDVRVEGHTDNIPIHTGQFDSNWELSTARATSIARLFLTMGTIPPERISAAGYAEFHPVSTNQTTEGRALNRRVDLVVRPRSRLNFATQPGTAQGGPWRRITDGDPAPDAADSPADEPAAQPTTQPMTQP